MVVAIFDHKGIKNRIIDYKCSKTLLFEINTLENNVKKTK